MAKAQGTMEFLMNYSWALIIIGIALAALVALGIFNPMGFGATSGQSGFSGISSVQAGYSLTSGGIFSINMRNTAGVAVEITGISATCVECTGNTTHAVTGYPPSLNSGSETGVMTATGFTAPAAGSKWTMDVTITYTASGIANQTSVGKVYGVV